MTIRKTYQPVLQALKEIAQSDVITEYANCTVIWKIYKITFNDLEYDIPTPKLPLWYRIFLEWHNMN